MGPRCRPPSDESRPFAGFAAGRTPRELVVAHPRLFHIHIHLTPSTLLTYPTMLCRPSSRAASVITPPPSRPDLCNPPLTPTARRPFCAPPLQTLRSPRAVRPTHTTCLHERRLQLTRDPGYATTNTDIFKPTKFGGKYTVTLIPGMRRAKTLGQSTNRQGHRLRLYDHR